MRSNTITYDDNPAIQQYKNQKYISTYGAKDLADNSAIQYAYGHTNENMRAYIHLLNLAGGRVATVGSSGDQAFYAIYKDAEEVLIIDGCPYAKPFIELKRAAIENMTYHEFEKYFTEKNVFNPKMVNELLHGVSNKTRQFFAAMYESLRYLSLDAITEDVLQWASICPYESSHETMQKHNTIAVGCEFYDNEDTFNTLKSKLKHAKIKYKLAEFEDFPKELRGKYSTIMLSNIFQYKRHYPFFNTATELIENNLKKGGTMQTHYAFSSYNSFGKIFNKEFDKAKCNGTHRIYLLPSIAQYLSNNKDFETFSTTKAQEIASDDFSTERDMEALTYVYEKE